MTARPWFATNARALLDARRQGMAPEGPVVVSLVGLDFPYRVLQVRPDMPVERLDWSMLVNVEVWLWADTSEPLERICALVTAIAAVKPSRFYLRFNDTAGNLHDVDIGTGSHRAGLPAFGISPEHEFVFCPVNASGSELGWRLTRALSRRAPGALRP